MRYIRIISAVLFAILGMGCEDGGEMKYQPTAYKSGYVGNAKAWDRFLSCWERETLEKLHQDGVITALDAEVFERGGQRFSEASESKIQNVEEVLATRLPKSLKDFWRVSDGWILLRLDADDGLVFGIHQVGWLRSLHPDLVLEEVVPSSPDLEYFDYSPAQDPVTMREEYINDMLVISEVVDSGVYLLNPKIKTADGEWEAWFYGWELPGAVRFRSFAHLMRYAYYKALHKPDYDGVYSEEKLHGTCADMGIVE